MRLRFKEMWQTHHIACITYHKHPKKDWPEDEFAETAVPQSLSQPSSTARLTFASIVRSPSS